MISFEKGGAIRTLVLLGFLSQPVLVCAAQHAFDIDLKELDQEKPAASKTEKAKKHKPAKRQHRSDRESSAKVEEAEEGYLRYTVRPGDHIFKILVAHFGMSNEKAEQLIPEIIRLNDIGNIKNLKVGKTLLIPGGQQRHAARKAKEREGTEKELRAGTDSAPPLAQLAPPPARVEPTPAATQAVTRHETVAPVRQEPLQKQETVAIKKEPVAPKKESVAAPAVPPPLKAQTLPAQLSAPQLPVVAPPSTWVCSVPEKDPRHVLDALMNVLSLRWSRNRIIQSEAGAQIAYSIMVDRYFEHKGKRYIITVGDNDPYNYTLLRLLESTGYKVLRLKGGESFEVVGEKLLTLVGVTPSFGSFPVAGGNRECRGFLIQEDDAGGRRVLVTTEAVSQQQKTVLTAGCAGS